MIDNVIFLLTGTRHKRDMKEVSRPFHSVLSTVPYREGLNWSGSCGLHQKLHAYRLLFMLVSASLCLQLLPKCHPLGMFEEIGALTIASTPGELYNSVLKETPLGPFMAKCMKAPDLDELNIEIIRNTLYKEYLSAFAEFCQGIGGPTAEVMTKILQVTLPALSCYIGCLYRLGCTGD